MSDASEQVDMVRQIIEQIRAGRYNRDTGIHAEENWDAIFYNAGLEVAAELFEQALT